MTLQDRYCIMFCNCMFFYFSEIHRITLQHMLSYDRNRRASIATHALLQQRGCLCCNKSLQWCACVATICCNGVLVLQETVATHFTVNDATCLNSSYHVLLQQTYAPGCCVMNVCYIYIRKCCIVFITTNAELPLGLLLYCVLENVV